MDERNSNSTEGAGVMRDCALGSAYMSIGAHRDVHWMENLGLKCKYFIICFFFFDFHILSPFLLKLHFSFSRFLYAVFRDQHVRLHLDSHDLHDEEEVVFLSFDRIFNSLSLLHFACIILTLMFSFHLSSQENVQYYRLTAYSGDTRSQTVMGFLHLEGAFGVERDYDEARNYFEQVKRELKGMKKKLAIF